MLIIESIGHSTRSAPMRSTIPGRVPSKSIDVLRKAGQRSFEPKVQGAALKQLKSDVTEAWRDSWCWEAFFAALAERDLTIAPRGLGVCYIKKSTRKRLAISSAVGPGYRAMILRFGEGLPRHPYPGVAERALEEQREWRAAIARLVEPIKQRRSPDPS